MPGPLSLPVWDPIMQDERDRLIDLLLNAGGYRSFIHLEAIRRTGIDDDMRNPKKRWRQLLADLRYLGDSGYPRLKKGQKWGDWTLDELLQAFGKIIDILRGVYFPLMPPKRGDPKYNSSYWQAYREAKAKGYIKTDPPKESDIPDWERRRKKLLQ